MKYYTKLLAVMIAWLVQAAGYAQSANHALVEGFPDSVLVSAEFEPDSNYRLIL